MSEELKPCPFCGGEMQLRQALWPSDGDTDAIIHKAIQGGPDGACGMSYFSVGAVDEGMTLSQEWNRRAPDPALSALREARGLCIVARTYFDYVNANDGGAAEIIARIDAILSGQPEWPESVRKLVEAAGKFARIKADDGDDFSGWSEDIIIRCEISTTELKALRAALAPFKNMEGA